MQNAKRIVASRDVNRRPTDGRRSLELATVPSEVIRPDVSSWIEQRMQNVRFGIVARWIRSFEQAACRAAQSEVLDDCWSVVLLGTNVIEMKRSRIVFLRSWQYSQQPRTRSQTCWRREVGMAFASHPLLS